MLAKIGSHNDLTRADYIFEPKLDGIRALCDVTKNSITLISRNGINITARYPELAIRKYIKATTAILDGEIIAYDKHNRPNFQLLQSRDLLQDTTKIEKEPAIAPVTYIIFDILMKNGESLVHLPLLERKKILAATITELPDVFEVIPYTHDGPRLWRIMMRHKFEGVMAKEKDALYYPGQRRPVWLKIKPINNIEAIIIGYTAERRAVSALALGIYDQGVLRYFGKVGTGFSEDMVKKLHTMLAKITRASPACPAPDLDNIHWVRPLYVAEFKYLEITRQKRLRHAVFLHIRKDKKPKECTLESQI